MTIGELANYAESQFILRHTKLSDWRPASDMYIDDLCVPVVAFGKQFVVIPYGIRFWLENGDSIIYVKNKEAGESKTKLSGIVCCKDCTYRGEINCPQYYRRAELSDDYFCADGERSDDNA